MSVWNYWTGLSSLLLTTALIAKTVTKGWSLELVIVCLCCLIINIYLGLLIFSLRLTDSNPETVLQYFQAGAEKAEGRELNRELRTGRLLLYHYFIIYYIFILLYHNSLMTIMIHCILYYSLLLSLIK